MSKKVEELAWADTPVGETTLRRRAEPTLLVDIDHTPDHVLHPSHANVYTPDVLPRVRASLHPGKVFALWSDDPPNGFLAVLRQALDEVHAHVVSFGSFRTGRVSACTVHVAR